jgi:hypothetical protein
MTRIYFLYRALESPNPYRSRRRLLRVFPPVSPASAARHCAGCARRQRLGSFRIRSPPWVLALNRKLWR